MGIRREGDDGFHTGTGREMALVRVRERISGALARRDVFWLEGGSGLGGVAGGERGREGTRRGAGGRVALTKGDAG